MEEVKFKLLSAFLMLLVSLGLYRSCRSTTKIEIEDIKTNLKYFPKHYIMPPRWIRKHFNLRKAYIPKFLLFRLYLAISFLILGPISAIICLIIKPNWYFVQAMFFTPQIFYVIDLIVFFILCHFFKKR